MARRYPLEPLVEIRREKSEQRALDLRQAAAKTERERRLSDTAKERRVRHEAGTSGEKERERTRLEQGEQSARDLQQAERYRAGAEARLAELSLLEREAARRAAEAELVEERARAALGTARAEVKAVEKHRERFHASEARAEEESEQEAAEERWNATKHGASRD